MKTISFPYQIADAQQIEDFDARVLLANEVGTGKAQGVSSNVLTPTGWIKMGDVTIGQEIIGKDGKKHLITGIYPQGVKPIFEITFTDGSRTNATEDHLWHTNTTTRNWRRNPYRTLTTKEIQDTLKNKAGQLLHYIPMVNPVEFTKKHCKLDPYLLGYCIANGCMTQTGMRICIPDKETYYRLIELLPEGSKLVDTAKPIDYRVKGPELKHIMEHYGLYWKLAQEKFIPDDYLWNSINVRISLLQGLMDGDGSISERDNSLEYYTSSPNLADDIVFLIQSLGGTAKHNIKQSPKYTYKGETKTGLPCHRIRVMLPKEITPFRLTRKVGKINQDRKYSPVRGIEKIEFLRKEKCQCITTDSPDHLYITDDFIVTHNTHTCLLWMESQPYVRPVIVVCPASLKENWKREAHKHLGMDAMILDSMTAPKYRPFPIPKLVIINYDIIGGNKRNPTGGWIEWLKFLKAELIILDEVHMISDAGTLRTRSVRKLCKEIPYIIALSATPIINKPVELFPVLNIIRPDLFPSFFSFASRYANPRRTPWGWSYDGAKNLDELHHILTSNCMIRRRAREVIPDLPDHKRHVVPVDLDDMQEYRSAEKDFLLWLAKEAPHKVKKAMKAERLVRLGYLKRLAGKLKIRKVIHWINDFLFHTQEKLIVFCVHKVVVDAITSKFHNSVSVTGKVSKRKRQLAFDRFNKDPRCNLFVGNIDAAGAGWSAEVCPTVMFAELSWTPGKHAQAEGRVIGINRGGGKDASAFYLIGRDTIEMDICEVIQEKQKVFSQAIDGRQTKDDVNLFDLLEEKLRSRTAL